MKVVFPDQGRITQGVVFSNLRSLRYDGVEVHGLVITARCDLAQGKFPILNYVPVVEFAHWLEHDGLDIVLSRCQKQCSTEVKRLLKEWEIAESILTAVSLREVVNTFVGDATGNARKKRQHQADKVVGRFEGIKDPKCQTVDWVSDNFPSERRAVIRELMTHKISGHYFLPAIKFGEELACYVALLREASFLPRELALAIERGLSASSPELARNPFWNRWMALDAPSAMSMPVGAIPSPHLEHLLQNFALLFSRIGLDDMTEEHISKYCDWLPTGAT